MLKRTLTLAALLMSSFSVHALFPGPYIGLLAGESYTNYNASNVGLSSADVTNNGFGGGLFVGYQFDNYWGMDLSYIQYNNTRFKNMNGASGVTGTVDENSLQLMFKGSYPFSDKGFRANGKLGVAYLTSTTSSEFPSNNTQAPDQSRFVPAYALGISYDITTSVPLELFWNQTFGGGNMQNANIVGLSLSYYFF